jgi:hypothetical protein
MMPINDEIERYTVDLFQDNLNDHDRAIRLTLISGHTVSVQFLPKPPADFLSITASSTTVKMPVSQYEHVYHLLQTESPVFFTALKVLGLSVARLSSDPEATGEGLADAGALSELLVASSS